MARTKQIVVKLRMDQKIAKAVIVSPNGTRSLSVHLVDRIRWYTYECPQDMPKWIQHLKKTFTQKEWAALIGPL